MALGAGTVDLLLRIMGDSRGAVGAIKKTDQRLRHFRYKLRSFAIDTQVLGRVLNMYLTVPIVAFGIASGKVAMDIESSWVKVRKVYDGTASDIDTLLEPAVTRLTKKFGMARKEVIDTMSALAAMGYKGSRLVDILTRSIEFATIGDIELNQAMETTIAISKIFKVEGKELGKSLALLNEIENATAADMGDLTLAVRQAGEVAHLGGVSLQELAAMMAVLRERAIPATEASFALKMILTRIRRPTSEAADILSKYNINITDMAGNVEDADVILQKIADTWGDLTEREKEDLATSIVGARQKGKLLSLLEDMAGEQSTYKQALEDTGDETKNLAGFEDELHVALDQSQVKWGALKARFEKIMELIGEKLIPRALELGEALAGWLEKFEDLDAPTQELYINLALIAAAAGPALMLLGTLALVLNNLIPWVVGAAKGFRWLDRALFGTSKSVGGFNKVVGYLVANPVAALLIAMAVGIWAVHRAASATGGPLQTMASKQNDVATATRNVKYAEQELADARIARKSANLERKMAINAQKKAVDRVKKATSELDRVEQEHGRKSPEYKRAKQDLKDANLDLEAANIRVEAATLNAKREDKKHKKAVDKKKDSIKKATRAEQRYSEEKAYQQRYGGVWQQTIDGITGAYNRLISNINIAILRTLEFFGLSKAPTPTPPGMPPPLPEGHFGPQDDSEPRMLQKPTEMRGVADGGWVGSGNYKLGERGRELVLDARTSAFLKKNGIPLNAGGGKAAAAPITIENLNLPGVTNAKEFVSDLQEMVQSAGIMNPLVRGLDG